MKSIMIAQEVFPKGNASSGKGCPMTTPPTRARPLCWHLYGIHTLKLAAAAGLVFWLVQRGKLPMASLGQVRWLSPEMTLFVLLILLAQALPALRWWLLLRIQKVRESMSRVLALTWAGYFASLLLPGAISGDVAKSWLILRRNSRTRARAFSTVLADRAIGLYSLLFLGGVSIAWLASQGETSLAVRSMAGLAMGLFLLGTLAGIMIFWAPTRSLLLRLLPRAWRSAWQESFAFYYADPLGLVCCFAVSLAANTCYVLCFSVAGSLLGQAVTWNASFLAGPLVALSNFLPLTPGGLGVGETAADQLFGGFGIAGGAALMVLVRGQLLLLSLPGAFTLMSSRKPAAHSAG